MLGQGVLDLYLLFLGQIDTVYYTTKLSDKALGEGGWGVREFLELFLITDFAIYIPQNQCKKKTMYYL